MGEDQPLLRVMSLHALEYCERLFYLEEIEGIRVADDRVYAGRTLHLEVLPDEPDATEIRNLDVSSEKIGLVGKVDAVRRRDGIWLPYEHKRGKPFNRDGILSPWPADALQVTAYAMLLEEYFNEPIKLGRVHYHGGNVTLTVAIDEKARQEVMAKVKRGRELSLCLERPPVTANDRKCLRCSLAPECLPEEERLAREDTWDAVRLFPEKRSGSVVHLIGHDLRVRRTGNSFLIERPGQEEVIPSNEVTAFLIHGYGQLTTQALHLCVNCGIPVHWLSTGGSYLAGLSIGAGGVQRKLRQYQALNDPTKCLLLAKTLVLARGQGQLRYILRATRGENRHTEIEQALKTIRTCLKNVQSASDLDILRGYEGLAGRAYFQVVPFLLKDRAQKEMYPDGRSRRPPQDRFNAVLSFGYALLYQSVLGAIMGVGLEPAMGFYHQPRTSAHPLVLDLMELFRVPVWDMVVIGSINRGQWDPQEDFIVTGKRVWLSDKGKAKAIKLYEERLTCTWKHPITKYSLSYERTIELETRLLEKEWSGEPGLFAKARLR